jgi:hypothetical protein
MRTVLRYSSLLLAGFLSFSCATLPMPLQEDLPKAEARWPHIQLKDLQFGRELYVAHCNGCHPLHLPKELTVPEWEQVMVKMQRKAKINDEVKEVIMKYVTTYAMEEGKP